MSVDFSSSIVFGWKCTFEEHVAMMERCNYEFEDGWICVNAYDDDSYYIYGERLCTVEEGSCIEINVNDFANLLPADFLSERGAALRAMGCGDWFDDEKNQRFPKLYLVGQIS